MQFILPSYDQLLINAVMTVEHNGLTHDWSLEAFSLKSGFEKDEMWKHMFTHINNYWKTRTEQDQLAIFTLFAEMREICDTYPSTDALVERLQSALQRLYDLHQFDDMVNWVLYSSKIHIPGPEFLEVEFKENEDKNHTRNKTYTIQDYVGLVALVLQLRLMVPIWGEFVKTTQDYYKTLHKEHHAFMLLEQAAIMDSEPMVKLMLYVKERAPEEGNHTAMIELISSEVYPIWITAMLVVRRLCLADVRGVIDQSAVLVRHISRHVHERVKRTDVSFGGVIKPKTDSNLKGSEENQISLVEGYKIKPEITEGDIGTIRHFARDPYIAARRMKPDINMDLVKEALKTFPVIKDVQFKPAQILLLQWMIKPVIPPEGVDFLSNHTIAKLLCVCQAVLWQEGHHMLAALATAVEINNNGLNMFSETSTKGRLTKEITEVINGLYPYQKRNRANKVVMAPLTAIDNMVAEFGNHAWTMTLPERLIAELNPKNPQSKRLLLPHNFRNKVAELAVYVGNRPVDSILSTLGM